MKHRKTILWIVLILILLAAATSAIIPFVLES